MSGVSFWIHYYLDYGIDTYVESEISFDNSDILNSEALIEHLMHGLMFHQFHLCQAVWGFLGRDWGLRGPVSSCTGFKTARFGKVNQRSHSVTLRRPQNINIQLIAAAVSTIWTTNHITLSNSLFSIRMNCYLCSHWDGMTLRRSLCVILHRQYSPSLYIYCVPSWIKIYSGEARRK